MSETSLRFSLGQTFIDEAEENGREIPGSDLVIGVLEVCVPSIISPRVLLDVAVGIGVTDDAPDLQITFPFP